MEVHFLICMLSFIKLLCSSFLKNEYINKKEKYIFYTFIYGIINVEKIFGSVEADEKYRKRNKKFKRRNRKI